MTVLGMAVAGMRQERVRILLVVFSTAIAISALCVALSLELRVRELMSPDQSNLVVAPAIRGGLLPLSAVAEIRKIPDADPSVWMSGFVGSNGDRYTFRIVAANDA